MLLPFEDRVADLRREGICHARFRDVVIAVAARHFLDHVRDPDNSFANIQAMRRRLGMDSIAIHHTLEFKMGKQLGNLLRSKVDPDQALDIPGS